MHEPSGRAFRLSVRRLSVRYRRGVGSLRGVSEVDERAEAQRRIESVAYWYHRIEVLPGLVTPGVYDPSVVLDALPLPADCAGLRILDLGTRDGFFAFELERRGAQVVALDPEDPNVSGYRVAADLLGSKVEYHEDNVYSLTPESHGTFDVVLCFGLLYHLRHPMLALDRIADVCTGRLFLETEVSDVRLLPQPARRRFARPATAPRAERVPPVAEFYVGEWAGDDTNWWIPSSTCAIDMLTGAGFACPGPVPISASRALFIAERSPDPTAARLRRLDESRSWAATRAEPQGRA